MKVPQWKTLHGRNEETMLTGSVWHNMLRMLLTHNHRIYLQWRLHPTDEDQFRSHSLFSSALVSTISAEYSLLLKQRPLWWKQHFVMAGVWWHTASESVCWKLDSCSCNDVVISLCLCAVSRCRMDSVILSPPSGNMAETFLMPNVKYEATKRSHRASSAWTTLQTNSLRLLWHTWDTLINLILPPESVL